MRKSIKKIIVILLLLFISLFVYKLIYGKKTIINNNVLIQNEISESLSTLRKNYATKKYESNNLSVKVDQKYEKIATIKTKSNKYEYEEQLIRKQINDFGALIQFEEKKGNLGYRKLNLHIGVPPENFDKMYNQLIKIGNVLSKQITKQDKTNEYKELNAKKASLEKIRSSLINLKLKGGKIDEHILLENRILEIEQQLQDLGVSLGSFDSENEFCTIQFSLSEQNTTKISFSQRIINALEWTVTIHLQLIASLFFMVLFAYLLLLGIEKIKTLLKNKE